MCCLCVGLRLVGYVDFIWLVVYLGVVLCLVLCFGFCIGCFFGGSCFVLLLIVGVFGIIFYELIVFGVDIWCVLVCMLGWFTACLVGVCY